MKSSLKQQSCLAIGVVLVAAIGYPICSFFPKMRSIARVRQEIRQQQNFITDTEKLRPMLTQQKDSLGSTATFIQEQRARMVAPEKLSQVFSTISKLAKENGTTTTRFEPHAPIKGDTYRKVVVGLGVTGQTASIQRLLAQLEQLPHTIWVQGLKLNVVGENSENTQCAAELAIFVDNREISD